MRFPLPSRRAAMGFTLVEMLVVVVILAVLATLTVPRMVGNDKREFRHAVEQVADLLTMFAQRHNLGGKIVGISHDRQRNWLMLAVMDIDPQNPGSYADWRLDLHVPPVKLPDFMTDLDVEIFADGDPVDASEWPLSSEVGQDRPSIQIVLHGAGLSGSARLTPHAVSPVTTTDQGVIGMARARANLDSLGTGREDW